MRGVGRVCYFVPTPWYSGSIFFAGRLALFFVYTIPGTIYFNCNFTDFHWQREGNSPSSLFSQVRFKTISNQMFCLPIPHIATFYLKAHFPSSAVHLFFSLKISVQTKWGYFDTHFIGYCLIVCSIKAFE